MIQEIVPVQAEKIEHVLPLDQNPAAVYLATLRPTGRRSIQHYLNVIFDIVQPDAGIKEDDRNYQSRYLLLPWHELRYQHTAAIRAQLIERFKTSPATINTALSALRRVLKEAWRLGLVEAEVYQRAADLRPMRGQTSVRKGRQLEEDELSSLLEVCQNDTSPAGARDGALVAILYGAGLRRSEVVKLKLADYNRETGAITVRSGKGGKDRLCYLGSKTEMEKWLQVRGDNPGPLFVAVSWSGRLGKGELNPQTILTILLKRGKEASLDSFSPHDFRRTFISDLLDAGADIATVQKLAGHADVSTTARYDRRGETTKQEAAALLSIKPKLGKSNKLSSEVDNENSKQS